MRHAGGGGNSAGDGGQFIPRTWNWLCEDWRRFCQKAPCLLFYHCPATTEKLQRKSLVCPGRLIPMLAGML